MTVEGKIEKSDFTKSWQMPEGKGTIYYHNLKVEGDNRTFNVGAKKQSPDFLAVGKQIKLDVTEGKNGWKAKVVRENNFTGGGKVKMISYEEIQRMCKASALKAAATINNAHERVVIDNKNSLGIARWVIDDIRSELPKWDSPVMALMISRQSALHSAAEECKARKISNVTDLLVLAQEKYEFIKG